jgi:predicted PurR-regulated permease PerM
MDGQRQWEPRLPRTLVAVSAISWRVLVIVAAAALLVAALTRLFLVVFPVILALLLATLLVPPARWLRAHRWPAAPATFAVLLGGLALLGVVGALIVPPFVAQFGELGERVSGGTEQVLDWLARTPLPLSRQQLEQLPERALEQLRGSAGAISSQVVSLLVGTVEAVAGLLLTFVLLFFFVKDGPEMAGWLLARSPASLRGDIAAAASRAWGALGAYLRGIAIVALVDALAIGLGLVIIGVPLVLPLMVLTFFGGFFPIVGATLAGLVAVLVALVSNGVVDALLVGGVVLAVQQLEGDILQPLVFGRTLGLHPVAILLALTAGAVLAGIVGAFLSVPLAAVASAVGNELRLRHEA